MISMVYECKKWRFLTFCGTIKYGRDGCQRFRSMVAGESQFCPFSARAAAENTEIKG
jgi:hypothetical protein